MRIEHVEAGGKMTTVLAKEVKVGAHEVADATRMDVAALRAFYAKEMDDCAALGDGVLLSLHLKATMMKVLIASFILVSISKSMLFIVEEFERNIAKVVNFYLSDMGFIVETDYPFLNALPRPHPLLYLYPSTSYSHIVPIYPSSLSAKVSDPIMFGHAVTVYYQSVFEKHAALFKELDVRPNNGVGDVYGKIAGHPKQAEVEADILAVYKARPPLAMVDSGRGITNLHAPNDVIIDASVPPVIRDGGMMWNWDDKLAETKMMIPDR